MPPGADNGEARVQIVPLRGFGDVLLGMDRDEVRDLLGDPDASATGFYTDDDATEVWTYHRRGIQLSFGPEDEFRLGMISFTSPAYRLGAIDLVGMWAADLPGAAIAWSAELTMDDDYPDPDTVSFECELLGLLFWCVDGVVEEVTMLARYTSDGETPIWPTSMRAEP